jgi:hypothetical protein
MIVYFRNEVEDEILDDILSELNFYLVTIVVRNVQDINS